MDLGELSDLEEDVARLNVELAIAAVEDRENVYGSPRKTEEFLKDRQTRLNDCDARFLDADYLDRIELWGYSPIWDNGLLEGYDYPYH